MRHQRNVNRLWSALVLSVAAATAHADDHQPQWLESLAPQPLSSLTVISDMHLAWVTPSLQLTTATPRVDSIVPTAIVSTTTVDAAGAGTLASLTGPFSAPTQSAANFGSTLGNVASVRPSETDWASGLATSNADKILMTPLILRDASAAGTSSFVVPSSYFNNRHPTLQQ
jgi:hypothetical protein